MQSLENYFFNAKTLMQQLQFRESLIITGITATTEALCVTLSK